MITASSRQAAPSSPVLGCCHDTYVFAQETRALDTVPNVPIPNAETFVTGRIKQLRRALRRAGGHLLSRPSIPAALVENASTCPVNDRGALTLPDESEWVVGLWQEVVDMAFNGVPYKYHSRMTQQPGKRYRWLLPLVVAGQVGGMQLFGSSIIGLCP